MPKTTPTAPLFAKKPFEAVAPAVGAAEMTVLAAVGFGKSPRLELEPRYVRDDWYEKTLPVAEELAMLDTTLTFELRNGQ
jgi:hypothetical protein